jgi:uncharacterized LabA/DUF88 family protein
VFVDAGYLLAAGGALCCQSVNRSDFTCRYKDLLTSLASFAEKLSDLELLRIYWYDAAVHATPTKDHLEIAGLTHVKLRLGRISGGRQKGVDSLIVRDLMTLARERAMVTAFLLAGDEDLREGVAAAQDMGVRVTVLGVPALKGNQAETLIREADEHIMLEEKFLGPHFSKVSVPAPQKPANSVSSTTQAKAATPTEKQPSRGTVAIQTGSGFATAWATRATSDEIKALLEQYPRIPTPLDAQLIREAEKVLGSLREDQGIKATVRKGFWDGIKAQKEQSSFI